jgi:hypothetical protein
MQHRTRAGQWASHDLSVFWNAICPLMLLEAEDAVCCCGALLDVDREQHFWMDGTQHVEIARYREGHIGLAAWRLVAGIE